MMSDTEDYEALRQKNIADRNAFLANFFEELKTDKNEINRLEKTRLNLVEKENKTPKPVRRRHKSPTLIYIREYNFRKRAQQCEGNTTLEVLFKELKIKKETGRKHKSSAKPLKSEIHREYELRPRKARQFENEDYSKNDNDNDNDYKCNAETSNNKVTSGLSKSVKKNITQNVAVEGKKKSYDDYVVDDDDDNDDDDEDDEDWLP